MPEPPGPTCKVDGPYPRAWQPAGLKPILYTVGAHLVRRSGAGGTGTAASPWAQSKQNLRLHGDRLAAPGGWGPRGSTWGASRGRERWASALGCAGGGRRRKKPSGQVPRHGLCCWAGFFFFFLIWERSCQINGAKAFGSGRRYVRKGRKSRP